MSTPAYHLRPNKAVDRYTLVESIRRLVGSAELPEYTYYGLGGPYLEDFRLLREFFPELAMVSIELSSTVYKRQVFHQPCGDIELLNEDLGTFLSGYRSQNRKGIFWLDYTWLKASCFREFALLLGKATVGSIIKTTLRCNPRDYDGKNKTGTFGSQFQRFLLKPTLNPPLGVSDLATLLQEMLQTASQQQLRGTSVTFQPICSFYYSDGTPMFSLTGTLCRNDDVTRIRALAERWELNNLDWNPPKEIDLPFLSTKERLHLQKHLPCTSLAGKTLLLLLGHDVDDIVAVSEKKMEQYARFYRYYPHFIRAIP
jgi:hypothetical protein